MHFCDGHSLDADVCNRLPNLVQLEGFDDGGDQLHAFIPAFTGKSDSLQLHFRVVLILRLQFPCQGWSAINQRVSSGIGDATHSCGARRFHSCVKQVRAGQYRRVEGDMSFMNSNGLDDLAKRLADSVPESLRAFGRDLEGNFKAVLQAQLAKRDLVTRQDFDVQAAILERTQAKLTAIEARLKELETKLSPP